MLGKFSLEGRTFDGEWRVVEGSRYFQSPDLYKENGFKDRNRAEELKGILERESAVSVTNELSGSNGMAQQTAPVYQAVLEKIEKKKEKKNPPLLYNLAELQNDCSRMFKISPDETLRVVQELYEKKLVTYPRTDARVLSTAVAKEISRNLKGLTRYQMAAPFAQEILEAGSFQGIEKTRYVNDKQITDHYAIIPTGQELQNLGRLPQISQKVYQVVVRRFLSVFYPGAVYQKVSLVSAVGKEKLFSSFKVLVEEGYLKVANVPSGKKEEDAKNAEEKTDDIQCDAAFLACLQKLKKGAILPVDGFEIKREKLLRRNGTIPVR